MIGKTSNEQEYTNLLNKNMSLKQNDIYNEYMYENNICTICKKEIRLELKGETTQGESYHQIHDESCILNGVEDNLESIARRIKYANKPMPEIKKVPWTPDAGYYEYMKNKYRYNE